MPTTQKERTVRVDAQSRKIYIEKKPGSAERTVKVD